MRNNFYLQKLSASEAAMHTPLWVVDRQKKVIDGKKEIILRRSIIMVGAANE